MSKVDDLRAIAARYQDLNVPWGLFDWLNALTAAVLELADAGKAHEIPLAAAPQAVSVTRPDFAPREADN
jgi:hypothetical protein